MAGKITINGVDLKTTYGFGTLDFRAWWDGLVVEIPSVSPFQAYHTLRGSAYSARPFSWPLRLFLRKTSHADRQTAMDSLRRVMRQTATYVDNLRFDNDGEVAIVAVDSGRTLYAVYTGDRVLPPPGFDWETGHAEVELGMMVFDQAKYSDPQSLSISTVAVEIAMGTLPCWWEAEIDGPADDPEFVVYEDNGGVAGTELWRIPLVGSVGSGETFTIDSMLHRVLYDDGATETDVTETAVPIDSGVRFRLLDGADEDSVWVALTTGSGTLRWRRRWR